VGFKVLFFPRISVCRVYFQGFISFWLSSERVEFRVFLQGIINLGAVEYDFKVFLPNFLRCEDSGLISDFGIKVYVYFCRVYLFGFYL